MVQSLNTKAIYTFASMILQRRPHLLVPHLSVSTISDIDFVALKEYTNIRAIIFDKDHTLTLPYRNELHPNIQYGLQSCINTFGRENVAIFSNSAGTNDDIYDYNALQIETLFNISVIRHTIKKPGGIEEVLLHFNNNNNNSNSNNNIANGNSSNNNVSTTLHPTQICMIGDRLLTDIVFGNLYNMFTIHTAPLPSYHHSTNDNDNNNNNNNNNNSNSNILHNNINNESSSSPSSSSSSASIILKESSLQHPKDNWTARILRPIENKILYRHERFGIKRQFFTSRFIPHPAYDLIRNGKQTFISDPTIPPQQQQQQ